MDPKALQSLTAVLQQAKDYRRGDISHPELGSVNGFIQAEEAKNTICDLVVDVFSRAIRFSDELRDTSAKNAASAVASHLNSLVQWSGDIENITKTGVYSPQYPNARQNLINNFVTTAEQVKNIVGAYELEIKVCELAHRIPDSDFFLRSRDEINRELDTARSKASEIQKLLANLQSKTAEQSVAISTGGFSSLSEDHRTYEYRWFIGFIITSIATIAAILFAIFQDFSLADTQHIIESVIQRFLAITTPALFMKICLSKYNIERNLRIIYKHRTTVLDQYSLFESAIGDDAVAKNQFRLEIAKYIFSDPETGYLTQAQSPSDINVSPIVSIADKLAGKS